jgi:hypothetical protein
MINEICSLFCDVPVLNAQGMHVFHLSNTMYHFRIRQVLEMYERRIASDILNLNTHSR